jgi:heavy metal sensor kinase
LSERDVISRAIRKTRGLRFRLTASYALFFSLLIVFSSLTVRQFLKSSQNQQAQDALEQQWAALRALFRMESGKPTWIVDPEDPDDVRTEANLLQVFLLANTDGGVMKVSPEFETLGLNSPAQIREAAKAPQTVPVERSSDQGIPYLIRGGLIADENPGHPRYYVMIGRSLANNRKVLRQFTLLTAGLIPLFVLSGCVIGWVLSGRGLSPVLEVAKAAQRISGSNLSLRIPTRNAGDELDFLIETFNQMIERLENSFRQIRQFSTDVSHELRTPITIIRGQMEVALFTAQTKEQYRDAIVDSLQDIERLSQIVRALLLLSQAETGQVVLVKMPVDLAEIVRDIVDQFQIPAEGAQVKLTVTAPERCAAELDRVQIERMLSNLLSNSIKFTPPAGEVRLQLTCAPDQAVLIVEDTGCGIDPEHLPHIFDRFYRAGSTDNSPSPEKGLGLGLSFVAWIAKAHQGSVAVDSVAGKGTVFTVTLPLASTPVAAEVVEMKKT